MLASIRTDKSLELGFKVDECADKRATSTETNHVCVTKFWIGNSDDFYVVEESLLFDFAVAPVTICPTSNHLS